MSGRDVTEADARDASCLERLGAGLERKLNRFFRSGFPGKWFIRAFAVHSAHVAFLCTWSSL